MSSLINDNLFLFLLLLGGILVCIRSHELFSTPSPRNDAQWLVDEMNLQFLTGPRQFASGYAFYLVPVLLLYVLLSVSPELLSLSMGIAGTTHSVGSLTIAGSEAQTFAPMLAATAVITLFSVKPFSIIEHAIRRLSHNVAGIPQYIQDIVRQIRQMNFGSISADLPLPRMQLDHVTAIPGLNNDLAAIGKLHEWIFGTTSILVWSDKAEKSAYLNRQKALDAYDSLKRKLVTSYSDDDDTLSTGWGLTDEELEEIIRQAREARVQLTRLLAVLVANQDEPLPSHSMPELLKDLVERAQRKRAGSHDINILAASTMAGLVISVLIGTLFNSTLMYSNELIVQTTSLNVSDNALLINGQPASAYYWNTFIEAAQATWWDVLGVALIFFTGCATALIYRAACINRADWEQWGQSRRPVFQYVTAALLTALSAGLFYELFLFVKLVAWPSLNVRNASHFASMLRDFGSDYAINGLLALLAIPSAIALCCISDDARDSDNVQNQLYDSWALKLVWSVGVVTMLLYLLIRLWIGEIHPLPSVLASLVVPGTSFLIMSLAYWYIVEPNQVSKDEPPTGDADDQQFQDSAPPKKPVDVVRHTSKELETT